jgi:hypothetical protein
MTVQEKGLEIIEEVYNEWVKGDPGKRISIDLENKILIFNIADLNNLHQSLKSENIKLKEKIQKIESIIREIE